MVVKALPVSTSNEGSYFDQGKRQRAHTPRGRFAVQRKIEGWRRSTLGLLYYPSYFSGGSPSTAAPPFPPTRRATAASASPCSPPKS